jgi:hypothetical protein
MSGDASKKRIESKQVAELLTSDSNLDGELK